MVIIDGILLCVVNADNETIFRFTFHFKQTKYSKGLPVARGVLTIAATLYAFRKYHKH